STREPAAMYRSVRLRRLALSRLPARQPGVFHGISASVLSGLGTWHFAFSRREAVSADGFPLRPDRQFRFVQRWAACRASRPDDDSMAAALEAATNCRGVLRR